MTRAASGKRRGGYEVTRATLCAVEVERVERCPVCGGDDRAPLHLGLSDFVFGVAPGTWDLHRCLTCRGAFLDPRPTAASIGAAYASYYTHTPPVPEPPSTGPARRLRNGYVNARLGARLAPASAAGRAVVPLLPPVKAASDRLFRHLPIPPGGRLLDVGCGNGQFVLHARDAGWEAEGIDVDEQAVAVGEHLRAGRIEDEPAETYDAITLSHVIEHVPDPVSTLRAVRRALKPGGRVWLATPNLQSPGHRALGRRWLHLDPPRHLALFTGASLRRALGAAGFTDVGHHRTALDAREVFAKSGAPGSRRALVADALALAVPGAGEELVLSARR